MASHNITIAKASFTAACLRPDVTRLTRDEVSKFHTLLEAAVSKCSPLHVQSCKNWLLNNVSPSLQRSTALGKYLLAFSKQVKDEDGLVRQGKTPATRRRLHILYVVNDLLHHEKYHTGHSSPPRHLQDAIQPHISELFQMVRSGAKQRVSRRLETLLDTWEHEQYFDKTILAHLRKGITDHDTEPNHTSIVSGSTILAREAPFIMPAMHGDSTIPYYDLPAANLMPHIVPNKPIPMRPDQIRALQLSAGPADESLINAVKDFLKDIDRMDNPYEKLEDDGIIADLDELGQLSYRNEADEIVGDTYYGWSREFCDKMKKRKDTTSDDSRRRHRSLSRSRSSSRSRSRSFSRSPPKRRRYGSLSRSRSRSHRSRSRSDSPQRQPMAFQQARPSQAAFQQATSTTAFPGARDGPYPLIPLDSDGLPLPPPRPPNYNGPWPPPPPPPLLSNVPGMAFARPPPFYPGSNVSPASEHQHHQH